MYKKLVPEVEEIVDEENSIVMFEEQTMILNSTGWFIWKSIENANSIDELVDIFMNEKNIIDIEREEVKRDFGEYVENLKEMGLIYE